MNRDGSCYLVTTSYHQKEMTQIVANSFSQSVIRSIPLVGKVDGSPVWAAANASETFMITRLKKMTILSNFEKAGEFLHPMFMRENDPRCKGTPRFAAVWDVPNDMKLAFASRLQYCSQTEVRARPDHANYLIALSSTKEAYRIPISNIFEDGAVCMGQFVGSAPDCLTAFGLALSQLKISDWNSDLMDTGSQRYENAKKMFRFKPTSDGIECVPLADPWINLCEKIATPVTKMLTEMLL